MSRRSITVGLLLIVAVALFHTRPSPAAVNAKAIEIGSPVVASRVPAWDARGLGPLPWQGIACLDMSADGQFVAVGTIAPPGDPNLFVLDQQGKITGEHLAGQRWLNDANVSDDGRFVAALSPTPASTASDVPRLFAYRDGKELTQLDERFKLLDFRPQWFLFHYGEHSNHLPRVSQWAGKQWVVAGDDQVNWLSPVSSVLVQSAHIGQGVTTAMAASPSGLAVVGRYGLGSFYTPGEAAQHSAGLAEINRPALRFQNLVVVKPDKSKPIVWSRPISDDVAPSPEPGKGAYGAPAPPYGDVRFAAPLAVAIDEPGERIAVADYQGWQRVFHPRDGSADIPFGTRFMPSRPTIHIYDAAGRTIRRVGPESFATPFWCDLTFFADAQKLLISPHNWTSRGLAGQSLLPADADARTLYLLDIYSGALQAVRFPDAIASVACGSDRIAVGCWDHKAYLLDENCRPIPSLPTGLDVGAPSLVRVARDGQRIVAATSAGVARMLDADGRELWRTDLNQTAAHGEKPWTKNQKAEKIARGIWHTNGGLAHSDLGSQTVIEAPHGLILIDPNAGASIEQNWARMVGAGLDPMQVKYVLITHEHGDHAPGAVLWRVITGAKVVAGAETAYVLQHHIPGGTGYGFYPPVPVDIPISADRELDLAGLKVKAIRLPGHTSGSMGYAWTMDGKTYVATGDLVMPHGVLGYSGSLDFSAQDVLRSLKKLAALAPDMVLGGHGSGPPDDFIAKGIEAGEQTGWSKMTPPKPNPLARFTQANYLIAAWLEPIVAAAYGDIDGDGRTDVAVLVPKGKGSAVKIYLNRGGRFESAPDAVVDLPELSGGWKLRLLHVGGGKAADFFVASESQSVLLLTQGGELKFKAVPLEVTRGAQAFTGSFHADGKHDMLIGSRFVGGYSLALQAGDGAFQVHPSKASIPVYLDSQLIDLNGDGRADWITSSGDIFLRHADGSLSEMPDFHLTPPPGIEKGWSWLAAADFERGGWPDVALLANTKEGVSVWLYRNTRQPAAPFPPEPTAKFLVPDVEVNRDGPTLADWNGAGVPGLILCKRGDQNPGAIILTGSPADGLNPRRTVSVKLDYIPYYDARFGVADFTGDGRLGLAGFGRSPTGAVGVYIWLQPAGAAK